MGAIGLFAIGTALFFEVARFLLYLGRVFLVSLGVLIIGADHCGPRPQVLQAVAGCLGDIMANVFGLRVSPGIGSFSLREQLLGVEVLRQDGNDGQQRRDNRHSSGNGLVERVMSVV